jgi:hypothetical protein
MDTAATADFKRGDRVVVLRKADRDGGGEAVVKAVLGFGASRQYTVLYVLDGRVVDVRADGLQPFQQLGRRKRRTDSSSEAIRAGEVQGSPRSRQSTPVATASGRTNKAPTTQSAQGASSSPAQ